MHQFTVSEYLHKLYGFSTRPELNRVTNTVLTTATKIANGEPNRVGLWIANNSVRTMYIFYKNTVSANNGFYLAPNGGNLVLQINDDFALPSWPWYAVAIGASANVTVLENIAI